MRTEPVANSARYEVLRRIRAAGGGVSADTAGAKAAWELLPRSYRRSGELDTKALLELFQDRLRDYDAQVVLAGEAEVAQTVSAILAARKVSRMLVPPGFKLEWLPAEVEFVQDAGLSSQALDQLDGVITGASVAIAQTGTVVLQNVAGQGRRVASLVPDYHLCVMRAEDVVETVPEAMERLHPTAHLATTFISGPSATADIEMTRIKGVHGPRFLDVILVV